MKSIRFTLSLLLIASVVIAAPLPQKTESFWTRVLKMLGVTATPANQKGDEDPTTDGDIWLYKVTTKIASPLKQGDFRSPIFLPSGNAVLALSGNKVVKFDVTISGTEVISGAATELFSPPGLRKLIAVESDAPDQVLVLVDLDNDNCPGVAVLNLAERTLVSLPNNDSKEDRDLVTYLKRADRVYDDGAKLEVKQVTKTKNGNQVSSTDAFLQLPRKNSVNVSNCRPGISCGQPAISSDRKFVLFIGKAEAAIL